MHCSFIAQTQNTGPSAAAVFYITILLIFLTAIVTAVVTKWARDKCLLLFHGDHITLIRLSRQPVWGLLQVFSSGMEILFPSPYVDARGRQKSSVLLYPADTDTQLTALWRYASDLSEKQLLRRKRQIHRSFNPGPLRRLWRTVRNFINTLRDAFNAAIGQAVGYYQRMNPASSVLTTQGSQVTQLGQSLLGKLANAYEPLLEKRIGQPVILEMLDPTNPSKVLAEYTGFLVDYTQQYVAIFNVEHPTDVSFTLQLPPLPPPADPTLPGLGTPASAASSSSTNAATTLTGSSIAPLPLVPSTAAPAIAPSPVATPASGASASSGLPAGSIPTSGSDPSTLSPADRVAAIIADAARQGITLTLDGPRLKVQNVRQDPISIRHLSRVGFQALPLHITLPPGATLTLAHHDADNATLLIQVLHCVDIIAPRRWAVVRHWGHELERRTLIEEIGIDHLPLIPWNRPEE